MVKKYYLCGIIAITLRTTYKPHIISASIGRSLIIWNILDIFFVLASVAVVVARFSTIILPPEDVIIVLACVLGTR